MAPKVDVNRIHTHKNFKPTEDKKPKIVAPPILVQNRFTPRTDFKFYGARQRDRLERLIPAGVGGLGAFNEIRLANATNRANQAYGVEYQKQLNLLRNPAGAANAPKDLVEVSQRATDAYRKSLTEKGFNSADVRGDSFGKTTDFLLRRANDNNGFSVLSEQSIVSRVNDQTPTGDYYVRIVKRSYLNSADAKLTGSEKAWMAFPDELAGAKLNVRGIMKNVGYDDATVYSPTTKASDYVLLVTEKNGQSGIGAPTWNGLFGLAKTHPDFIKFQSRPPQFWDDVRSFSEPRVVNNQAVSDYKSLAQNLWDAQGKAKGNGYRLSVDEFLSHRAAKNDITTYQADLFKARYQLQNSFGANENFAGKGWTLSPDGRIAVREQLVNNTTVFDQPRHSFLELRDGDFNNPAIVNRTNGIVENPLRLGSEFRGGALMGGAFSAVTSLPQIFDQARGGDYAGATKTLVVNTSLGTSVGGASGVGARLIGNQIENGLSRSNLVQNGLDRLYTSGAARSVVSRFAATESSTISSQTFSSAARTFAGRIGGAGVVGGIVNGAFSAYDQIGAYKRGEVTASQAIGTVTGEAAVGVGAGMAGAAAGAAIGSIIPGAGTIVGGIIGFGVGMAAGYLADKGLRGLGVDKMIAGGVTAAIDKGAEVVNNVGNALSDAGNAISGGLKSIFG